MITLVSFYSPTHTICPTGSFTPLAESSNVRQKNSLVSQGKTVFSKTSTCMLARFRIGNLARCWLLPVLLIQKPVAKFAIMQSYIDSSLSIVVKKIKFIQKICHNEHRSELLKHFGTKDVRCSSKCTMFF